MVSTPVTIIAVVAAVGLGALLIAGIAYAARVERRPAALWLGGGGVVAWLVLAFALAKSGFFETTPASTMPPRIAAGIMLPTILGCALLAFAPVRALIARIPLHWLVGVQFYRVVGGIFLIAYLQDDIPGEFALPAGIGDVAVGLLAPFVALTLARNGVQRAWPAAVGWCTLGIFDLLVAVTCGFLTAPSTIQQLALDSPNAAITSYPLVLIPVFAVPASLILHVFVIARLNARTRHAAQAQTA